MHFSNKNIVQVMLLLIINKQFYYCYRIISFPAFITHFLPMKMRFTVLSPIPRVITL